MTDENTLAHIGVARRSGRYPWGSGDDPQAARSFLDQVNMLKSKGMADTDIAKAFDMNTTQLRAAKSIARNESVKAEEGMVLRLKEKGMSNVAIGQRLGIPEATVRQRLNPAQQLKTDRLTTTTNKLKDEVADKTWLDVGTGVENHMGISRTQLNTAIEALRQEGYEYHYVKVTQLGTGKETTLKVLAPPGTKYTDTIANKDKIGTIDSYSDDRGKTYNKVGPPVNVDSKRVQVRYGPEGGSDMDGVIELRRGVDDISLGQARYAQVRIAVDGTHYLKGMAMYADDLPDGVDMRFNTNKGSTGNKLDAMKAQKTDDPTNPFGASIKVTKEMQEDGSVVVRQRTFIDKDGKQQKSAINIVNEEGNWNDWSPSLSSQMLSKQSPKLAKQQLDITFSRKQKEYDEIMALTNPTVKKRLLESFADDADSSAVHLKAAALPRQATKVILPIKTLKDNEIYAPSYRDGERVVLVRYPHGGIFEIPELTVNNRHAPAKRVIQNAIDAVGIHPNVAARLSGADFDGDTVLVIPNNNRAIRNKPPLDGLKGFDPQAAYPKYEGMKPMSPRTKQLKMGDVSNLITDMTIKGASDIELARAVRHSMVVIDAEKHKLNWKQSAKDNGISELKKKYQGDARAGAKTLISQASSPQKVIDRKARPASEGGPIDIATGRKVYVNKPDAEYTNKAGNQAFKKINSTKMAETNDAFSLSSGTPIENVYAEHANKLKALGNSARKAYLATPNLAYSPSAKKVYAQEEATLTAKLNLALKNAPRERQAQLVANTIVKAKQDANPEMEAAELKKIKGRALTEARIRTGADKQRIEITPREWEAIQAGAISNNRLSSILANTDLDKVKALATPRTTVVMNDARVARAKAMANAGYTQAEIADAIGNVSPSTLSKILSEA